MKGKVNDMVYQFAILPTRIIVPKTYVYYIHTSNPMHNYSSSRHWPTLQLTEKAVVCSHWQDWSSTVHLLGGAAYFLSGQCDIIASFLFGTCTVKTDFSEVYVFFWKHYKVGVLR